MGRGVRRGGVCGVEERVRIPARGRGGGSARRIGCFGRGEAGWVEGGEEEGVEDLPPRRRRGCLGGAVVAESGVGVAGGRSPVRAVPCLRAGCVHAPRSSGWISWLPLATGVGSSSQSQTWTSRSSPQSSSTVMRTWRPASVRDEVTVSGKMDWAGREVSQGLEEPGGKHVRKGREARPPAARRSSEPSLRSQGVRGSRLRRPRLDRVVYLASCCLHRVVFLGTICLRNLEEQESCTATASSRYE